MKGFLTYNDIEYETESVLLVENDNNKLIL